MVEDESSTGKALSSEKLPDIIFGVCVTLMYELHTTFVFNDDLHIYQLISYYRHSNVISVNERYQRIMVYPIFLSVIFKIVLMQLPIINEATHCYCQG